MTTREDARGLDDADPLAGFRERFTGDGPGGAWDDGPGRRIYLDGNSLGRLPRATPAAVARVVEEEWGRGLVGSWAHWVGQATRVGDVLAAGVLGARPGEVLVADSTSVNLYKLLQAGVGARPGRDVLVCCADDFPTDRYVVAGVAEQHGMTVREVAADVDTGLTLDDITAVLDDRVAVVVLSLVAYRSGAMVDLAAVTELARASGALVLWDLSHAVGSVEVDLSAADLAVGCTYKHLNGGPGAPAFLYVRRELQGSLRQPIQGWFGQRDQFAMGPAYEPTDGVERFAVGTPPVLATAAVEVGARISAEAGMPAIAAKGRALTDLLVTLVDERLPQLRLASPRESDRRGAHVSVEHPQAWQLTQALVDRGVVPDFRTPDRIRFGPAPLYTRFVDVWDAVDRLADVLASDAHLPYSATRSRVT
ncbi:Kynureninase [Klenkia marina]|uniref:Kynureninase n=1 Tax=Klenkia marina TaxID=1960309 RepID=A0A1G4Y624_9ACTN|nr:kynureninase [Klenkia marina]SCX48856.1 Kynureninase [Klenkia marina]